jgi:hypothetical protein
MPSNATSPAPVRAPATRAESDVVRSIPIAPTSCAAGIVSPTRAARMPMSDGLTMPVNEAITNTCIGESTPSSAKVMSTDASVA